MKKMKAVEKLSIDECWKELAELARGLAHPARVEIIRILEHKPREAKCVCGDIVDAFPLSQSSVSQHLKTLKKSGWIQGEADGSRVCYCTNDGITEYFLTLFKKAIQGIE
jgi:DNA-binding transcriptional ArsR family regulator